MPVILFNSKKKFWNPVLRIYQDEPVVIDDVEFMMTHVMAILSDDTCDVLRFETADIERAKKFIEKFNITKKNISIARHMNKMILKMYRSINGLRNH